MHEQKDRHQLIEEARALRQQVTELQQALQRSRTYRPKDAGSSHFAQELKDSQLSYRSLFDQSVDAVFIINLEGVHLAVNQRAAEMLGYTPQEIVGLSFREIIAPDEQHRSLQVLQRLLAGERVMPYERWFRRNDGTTFPAEINVEIVRDARGEPLYIQSIARDISERKAAEARDRAFLADMRALQTLHLELTQVDDLETLYRRMVELAQERLGLDRVALFLIDAQRSELYGTYGVDTQGAIRKEEYYREAITPDHWTREIYDSPNRVRYWDDVPLMDDGEVVGTGWKAAAALWDGEQPLGYLIADNYLRKQAARPYQTELISILGSTYGHLISAKRSSEELRNSEERYRQMFQNNRAIKLLIDPHTGRIVDANRSALDFYGYPLDEIRTMRIQEINMLGDQEVQEEIQRALSGETSFFEFRHQLANGEVRDVEVHTGPVRLPHKEYLYSIITDVTPRKEAEAALRESQERLSLVIDAAGLGIWDWNVETGEVAFNERWAQMLDYRLEEIAPNLDAWIERVHHDDQAMVSRQLAAHIGGESRVFESEHRLCTKSGYWKWVFSSGRVVETDDDGLPSRILGIMLDIDERKRVEQQNAQLALEKERAKILSRFVQDASHEFRTPLATILTSLYLVRKTHDAERKAEKMEQIEEQVNRMKRLVDMLLLMSGLDDDMSLQGEPVQLDELLRGVVSAYELIIAEAGVQVTLVVSPEPLVIHGDREHLQEACEHLLDNALRYTPEGGSVVVRCVKQETCALIEVQDTGIGIREEHLAHIFKRFWRGDDAHSTPGFGLGLAIVQQVVQQHRGRIEVESEVGVGSTFRLLLPSDAHGC